MAAWDLSMLGTLKVLLIMFYILFMNASIYVNSSIALSPLAFYGYA
jgi:hypothetical protein